MTVASYPLGRLRLAASRGGDCRARDLGGGDGSGGGFGAYADQYAGSPVLGRPPRNVHGPHRFAATTDCQISNGMLRLTVGAAGSAPTLTVEAWRGRVTEGDVYESVYRSTYGGTTSTPAWFSMGTLTIDSPSVSALLTAVRIVRISAEGLTIRLRCPLIADAFVTLRRGHRSVFIQHGSTRPPFVTLARRLRWTGTPSPIGVAKVQRVQEASGVHAGMLRWIGSFDPATADASAFKVTADSAMTARFGAGVGSFSFADHPASQHAQTGDASRPMVVVS